MSQRNLKRKAEQQLTRSTTDKPNQEAYDMFPLQATFARVSNICRSIYNPIYSFFFGGMSAETSQGSPARQSEDPPRTEYESATIVSEKRQRPSNYKRNRSLVDRHRKAGRGTLNIESCNEEEARRRIDQFWEPPELGFSRPKLRVRLERPTTPESLPEGWNQERRHSDPSISHRKSSSSSTSPQPVSNHHVFRSSNSLGKPPATPESLPENPSAPNKVEDVANRLDNLLLESDGPELRPSGAKIEQLKEDQRIRHIEDQKRREEQRLRRLRAARQTAKDRRLHRQYPLKALVEPLGTKWDEIVDKLRNASHNTTLTTSVEGTELRFKDFNTLLGDRAWLNDEIINSYIEWVVVAANEAASAEAKAFGEVPGTVPKFIAHNSFFYTNLRNKGPSSTDRLMKRKKAPGASLMEVDTVFVPICQGAHWTIGVVRPVAKTIEYFDSMGGSPAEFIRQMRGWLKHQLGSKYKDEEWTTPKTACAVQTNGYDCGVFVCTNAFCVASGIDTSCYEQEDMTPQRRCIAAVLLNRGFTEDFMWGQGGLLPLPEYPQLDEGGPVPRGEGRITKDIECGGSHFQSSRWNQGGLVAV